MLLVTVLAVSCFKDNREIEYAKVYLPLASRATNGVFDASFNCDADTSFIVGAYCSGSIMTKVDVDVRFAPAVEEFEAAKETNARLADYTILPEEYYQISPSNLEVTIKAGTDRADLKVHFYTSSFDRGKKYVLPLKLESVSEYEIAENYNVLFFGVTAK